jgi:hypothetical protein
VKIETGDGAIPLVVQPVVQISAPSSSVMDRPSDARCSTPASSPVLARHSDGGIPKPTKSLLRRGFLNPLPSVASGLAPPPPVPTARAPGALDSGSASWRFRRAL